MGEKYICLKCEYKWVSRKDFGTPSICPHCKSNNIKDYDSKVREDRIKQWEEWQENIRRQQENARRQREEKNKLREKLGIPHLVVTKYRGALNGRFFGILACFTIWGLVIGIPLIIYYNNKLKSLRFEYPRIEDVA